LAVTATVTDGDLVVEGDADGAIEIVAVSAGAYRVTDNGIVVADETVLQGITDDIHIELEVSIGGTNDIVTVDLAGQTVDKIYADLGNGDNSFELLGGTAGGFVEVPHREVRRDRRPGERCQRRAGQWMSEPVQQLGRVEGGDEVDVGGGMAIAVEPIEQIGGGAADVDARRQA
jgi:hypothetical protein